MQFGDKDAGIPLSDVESIRKKQPQAEIHVYPGAQHGFHCDERASFHKASADLAWSRSMEFLKKNMK
jgi:carboxymethylenebutenolidase